eukprot:SAG25_NODE_4241_length_857_cov_67.354881_1_plen_248_part_10
MCTCQRQLHRTASHAATSSPASSSEGSVRTGESAPSGEQQPKLHSAGDIGDTVRGDGGTQEGGRRTPPAGDTAIGDTAIGDTAIGDTAIGDTAQAPPGPGGGGDGGGDGIAPTAASSSALVQVGARERLGGGPSGVSGEAVKTGCECSSSVGLNRGTSARGLLPARGLDVGVTAADRRARRRGAGLPLSPPPLRSRWKSRRRWALGVTITALSSKKSARSSSSELLPAASPGSSSSELLPAAPCSTNL